MKSKAISGKYGARTCVLVYQCQKLTFLQISRQNLISYHAKGEKQIIRFISTQQNRNLSRRAASPGHALSVEAASAEAVKLEQISERKFESGVLLCEFF